MDTQSMFQETLLHSSLHLIFISCPHPKTPTQPPYCLLLCCWGRTLMLHGQGTTAHCWPLYQYPSHHMQHQSNNGPDVCGNMPSLQTQSIIFSNNPHKFINVSTQRGSLVKFTPIRCAPKPALCGQLLVIHLIADTFLPLTHPFRSFCWLGYSRMGLKQHVLKSLIT